MTLRRLIATASLLALGIFVMSVQAQPGSGLGKSNYDPSSEVTLSGIVESIDEFQGQNRGPGIHLMLKVGKKSHEVHLGPKRYYSEEGIEIAEGQQLEVVGSQVTVDGKEFVIVRLLTHGEKTWTLRDEDGRPMWRRSRGGQAR